MLRELIYAWTVYFDSMNENLYYSHEEAPTRLGFVSRGEPKYMNNNYLWL